MHNQFTITIHDDHGIKQFNLHQIIKRISLYLLLFVLFIFALAAFSISYLNMSVNKIQMKKNELQANYAALKMTVQATEETLQQKHDELSHVTGRLTDIEDLIGLSADQSSTLQERVELATVTSEEMAALMQHIPNGSPIEYNGITSKYGSRIHPTLARQEFHRGTDLKAPMDTAVYATADSIIEWAGMHEASGYGKLIILDHSFGFKTYFGHLNKIVVKSGQFIKRGDLVGYTGNTGMSNGPHLHYEVRFLQRALNPFWFIKWNVASYNTIFEKETNVPWQSLIAATTHLHKTTTIPLSSQKVLLSRAR